MAEEGKDVKPGEALTISIKDQVRLLGAAVRMPARSPATDARATRNGGRGAGLKP